MEHTNLLGKEFGRLRVLSRATNTKQGKARWLCECSCGRQVTICGEHLRRALTRSCGCWRIEAASIAFKTHGLTKTPEHRSWTAMKDRCGNPNTQWWHRYGGRGIVVCERWVNSFETFLADMGPRPSRRHSIERENNDGNYEPGNCIWALPAQQATNRSSVCMIAHDGITDTMAGWARRTGVPYLKLRRQLKKGWTMEQAIKSHI